MATERLLFATANQSQKYLEQLDAEIAAIRELALFDARLQHHIEVVQLSSFGYQALSDYINSEQGQTITMLHYIGHSSAQGLQVDGPNGPILLSTSDLAGLGVPSW